MKLKCFLIFVISTLLFQLNAQPPSAPPCEGTVCQGVCLDLTVTASNMPAEFCSEYHNPGFPIQLDITGTGADIGNYEIWFFYNNNFNSVVTHNSGDPTSLSGGLNGFTFSCEPVDHIYTYEIQCPDNGSVLGSGTLGNVLLYPEPFLFFPTITPSIACVQNLMITPGFCGTVDLNLLPLPNCDGEDYDVNWNVDFGFQYPPDCPGFPFLGVGGFETVFGCDGEPGDPCDDNNPCTSNDTLDENCGCVSEGATAILNTPLPAATCIGEVFTVSVSVDMIPSPDGVLVGIVDQYGGDWGSVQIFPGDPLTFDIDIGTPLTFACDLNDFEFFLELRCPANNALIGNSVPLGTVIVFPDIDIFTVEIEPAIECDVAPVIVAPYYCGDLVLNEMPADPAACPTGSNGFVEYTLETVFDLSAAPPCFDVSLLTGQVPIIACSNCCPLVADVTLADEGPFCSGDITEVCMTFDAPFETDGQVSINGVDAIAGEDQFCFQLDIINDGCSYEPFQIPVEIICNEDGTLINALSQEILVAPDPSNFQYVVNYRGCGIAPFINSLAANSPCPLSSFGAQVIITDPVDGCPPIDGEVEVPFNYADDNDNVIDVTAFGCDGFEESIILPLSGCTTCPCPTPLASVDISPTACENDLIEICLEFEADEAVNSIGTWVEIIGDFNSFTSFVVSGNGTSVTYCSEFVSRALVECEPITENFTVDIICGLDGSSLFYGNAATTIYPSLDKFTYEVTPAVDNCPLEFVPPEIVVTGTCDLDIQTAITTMPVNDCPPVFGEITYSINYNDPTLFANAPAACLFTPIVDAVVPIPACDTCSPDCVITPDMATNIVCNDNGTLDDASDDTYTFDIMVNGSNTVSGATNTFNDDQGNTSIAYGSTVSYGPYPIAGGNVVVNFTDSDDANCTAMMMATAPTTCSGEVICEDEIMGTVFAPAGCNVNGIEVTIYDYLSNIIVVLTTDMNGVYDSTPDAYPCGNYSVELTNNLPQCYLDASGETGPKTFVIDGDDNNMDTDGQDFMPVGIPTLSQWGLIILCLLMMCFGAIKMSGITLANATHKSITD